MEKEIEDIKNCSLENLKFSTDLSGFTQGIRNGFGLWDDNNIGFYF